MDSKFRRFLIVFVVLASLANVGKAQTHANTLTWTTSPSTGAAYNVYKQPACTGSFVKLNTVAITALTFVDTGMLDGDINCYYVSAVVGTSESTQAQSQVIRLVTPTITQSTASVVVPPVVTAKNQ